jgi:hypothetical protein
LPIGELLRDLTGGDARQARLGVQPLAIEVPVLHLCERGGPAGHLRKRTVCRLRFIRDGNYGSGEGLDKLSSPKQKAPVIISDRRL